MIHMINIACLNYLSNRLSNKTIQISSNIQQDVYTCIYIYTYKHIITYIYILICIQNLVSTKDLDKCCTWIQTSLSISIICWYRNTYIPVSGTDMTHLHQNGGFLQFFTRLNRHAIPFPIPWSHGPSFLMGKFTRPFYGDFPVRYVT